MIVLNFKNYKEGKEVLTFAKKIDNKCVIAAVPSPYISEVVKKTKLIVYAQHIDNKSTQRDTGFLALKQIKKAGASGSIINHSEHKIPLKEIKEIIKESKKEKLNIICCVSNLREVEEIKKLKPFAIAYEDEKLIATSKSITDHNPIQILKFVKLLKGTKIFPLCGAGINTKEDVENSIRLGCKGVLIASAIMNSKNPKKFLLELKDEGLV